MCFSRGSLSVHTTKARQTRSSTRTALWRHTTFRQQLCVHTVPACFLRFRGRGERFTSKNQKGRTLFFEVKLERPKTHRKRSSTRTALWRHRTFRKQLSPHTSPACFLRFRGRGERFCTADTRAAHFAYTRAHHGTQHSARHCTLSWNFRPFVCADILSECSLLFLGRDERSCKSSALPRIFRR